MAILWADHCWYQSGCGCLLLSAIPLLQFVLIFLCSHFFWVDRSAGSQPCLSPSPSCHYSLRLEMCHHDNLCIRNPLFLHFWNAKHFFHLILMTIGHILKKKYLLLFFFQGAYSKEWPVEALPGREGSAAGSSVLGVIITIRLHCVQDLSHSSEEQNNGMAR